MKRGGEAETGSRLGEWLETRDTFPELAEVRKDIERGLHRRAFLERLAAIDPELARTELERFKATRCRARTRRGRPCEAKGLPRNGRCRFHGGLSTGPRTIEGRRRALQNLKPLRGRPERIEELLERAFADGGPS